MKKGKGLVFLIVLVCVCLTGCQRHTAGQAKRREVEFTVVEQRKLPEELAKVIEENKKKEIRMTFADGEYLYLVRGYGEQKTGGYSISVTECTEDEEKIYFDTQLIGPPGQEELSKEPSYPFLAVKIEAREKDVVIQ